MKNLYASVPGATLHSNGSANGSVPLLPLPDEIKKVRRTPIGTAIKTYYASLLTVGVVMPVIASFVAVGLYVIFTLWTSNVQPTPGAAFNALLYSAISTGLLWLIAAFPAAFLCTARGANPRNYNLLCSRLHQLKAALKLEGDVHNASGDTTKIMQDEAFDEEHEKHKRGVMNEARVCYMDVSEKLNVSSVGHSWSTGEEYISAWMLLHHAEEALIEVEDIDTVLRGAKHDFLAIQGSQVDGKDGLLADILRAVALLKLAPKAAEAYLEKQQPDKLCATLGQLTELIHRSESQSHIGEQPDKKGENSCLSPKAEALARATLREVRSTLNDFRDKRWEGLVRQRNRLLKAIVATGSVTYAFVCFALANVPPLSLILASTLFYMVGAVAGLFVRFYRESKGSATTDDFGLSTIRLLSIPLLSGLAGIAGAIAILLLPDMYAHAAPGVIPTSISLLLTPQILLAAAAFGASPNLVIKGLQEKADKYETELQSSKAAETGK